MKHPVLRIKKGAVVYDDTAAREASELPRPALPGTGPFFARRRRRRGIPVTFFPLLVVAIGLFILFQVVPNATVRRSVLNGWQATLRATPFQDRLIIGVTFISGSPVAGNPADAPEATARLSLPGTGEQTFVAGRLDKSPLTLRGDLPRIPGAKKVQAEIKVGNAHVTLRIPAP
jgi:hypothetical protein